MRLRYKAVVCCLAFCLAALACGEKPAPAEEGAAADKTGAKAEESTVDQLLNAAIEAQGGIEKLKAASSWRSSSKGTYMGMPYEAVNLYNDGVVRMDITMPGDEKMAMVTGVDNCWMTSGPVVIDCSREEREANRVNIAMSRASLLWPLEEPGWKISPAGAVEVGGRKCDAIEIEHAATGAKGILAFDPVTRLLAFARYDAKMMGQPVRFESWPSDYEDFCGVKMAARWKMTMNGKPYVDEEILDLACVPIEAAALAPPEQVADNTVVERTFQACTGACVTMKGPYSGTGEALGRLMGFLGGKQLMPMGAPMMAYLKAPPEVKDPAEFETEVCFPVGAPPPAEPQVEGAFTIKAFPRTKVLAAYGLGPYDKRSPELAGLVAAELGKRGLEATGPMRQISYSDPQSVPPEKLVSEVQIPIASE